MAALARRQLFLFAVLLVLAGSSSGAGTDLAYVTATGNDRADCSQATPCQSLDRAYHAVACNGQVVVVGKLPYQLVRLDQTKACPVTVSPSSSGGSIDMVDLGQDQLGIPAPNQLKINLPVSLTRIWGGTGNSLGANVSGHSFQVLPAAFDTRIQGSYGPCDAARDEGCVPLITGTRTLLDGARLHDQTSSDPVRFHPDGAFVRLCVDCKIKSTKFDGNDVTNIRVQNCCGSPAVSGLQIIDTDFGMLNGGRRNGIDIDNVVPGLLIQNTRFDTTGPQIARDQGSWRGAGARIVTSTFTYLGPCVDGISYEQNTVTPFSADWGNTLCGTDRWATSPPPPTTSTTPSTTTAPTTSTTPTTTAVTTTTSAPYKPACAPTCDEQLAAANTELARLRSIINRAAAVLGEK